MKKLSDKQLLALRLIASYIERLGRAPTFQELADELGLKNRSSGLDYVRRLQRKGLVDVLHPCPNTTQVRITPTGNRVLGQRAMQDENTTLTFRYNAAVNEILDMQPGDFISVVTTSALEADGLAIGDKAVIRPTGDIDIRQGEICLIRLPDQANATLRKVSYDNGFIILSSSNPLYPEARVQGASVEILGVLVARLRIQSLQ